jgi:hypothetical protein
MDPVISHTYGFSQRQTAEEFPRTHPNVSQPFYACSPLLTEPNLSVWLPPS